MRQRLTTFGLMVVIALAALGMGAASPDPQAVSAAATDSCASTGIWTPTSDGSRIYYRANISCSTTSLYKITIYLCGGINGNGYCGNSKSAEIFGKYLDIRHNCAIRYSGPYWLYTGVKVQSPNYYGQPANDRWFFGPGAYVQGSC